MRRIHARASHVRIRHLAGVEQNRVGNVVARDELGHGVLIVPGRVDHREDRHLVAVLLLHSLQRIRERSAMRAGGLHEVYQHDLAAIIGQIEDLHLGIGQGKTRRAAPGVLTGGDKRGGAQ